MCKDIDKIEKICTTCKKTKPIKEFRFYKTRNYYHSKCKQCEKEYNKKIKSNLEYRLQQKEYQKEYRKAHKRARTLYNTKYYKKRAKTDTIYKLKHQIRRNIYCSFKRKSFSKYKYTKDIVGIDIDNFVAYLLNTYYKNYGIKYDEKEAVHIDHIIPLYTAKTEEEVYKLCHYTNLQLLKAQDNLQKGRSVIK